MEPNIVRVGNIFLNLSMLLWAEIRNSPETNRPILSLIYGNAEGNQRFIYRSTLQTQKKSFIIWGQTVKICGINLSPLDTFQPFDIPTRARYFLFSRFMPLSSLQKNPSQNSRANPCIHAGFFCMMELSKKH